jgi:uncharacterized protein YndB with AHSA1/START domain
MNRRTYQMVHFGVSDINSNGVTMGLQQIDIHASTPATASHVFTLLGDSSTWPSWTPIDAFELEQEGTPDGGEIRRFRNGRYRLREQIVERVPDRRLSYTVLSGLAVRDYLATIDLTPSTHGTQIHWHTTFRAKVPGFGGIYRKALLKATEDFVNGLVARSVESAHTPA